MNRLNTGKTVSAVARKFSCTRQTIMRIRDAEARAQCDTLQAPEQNKG